MFLFANNGWLELKCVGTLSNRSAIGTKIHVKARIGGTERWQMRQISGAEGWLAINSLEVGIGLGDASMVDLLRLEWPSGLVQEMANVPVKQTLEILDPIQVASAQIPLQGGGTGGLRLTGSTSRLIKVAASSDLVHWSPVGVAAQEGDRLSFVDPDFLLLRIASTAFRFPERRPLNPRLL